MRCRKITVEDFSRSWTQTIRSTTLALSPRDQLKITSIDSLEQVQKLSLDLESVCLQRDLSDELNLLASDLQHLDVFLGLVSASIVTPIDKAIVWGLVGLIVQSSLTNGSPVIRVPQLLRILAQNVGEFSRQWLYCGRHGGNHKSLHLSVAQSMLSVLVFTTGCIRDRDDDSNDGHFLSTVEEHFHAFDTEVLNAIASIEETSSISDFSKMREAMSDEAILPCYMYPSSRTVRFFDRKEYVSDIKLYFGSERPDGESKYHSLTLYGIGGVGKSTVALRYAEEQIQCKAVDAMLWVGGEKEVTLRQGFTDIANRLKLPGAQFQDHDQNKGIVLGWLQSTECRWLLVFDNVESVDLLMSYWPNVNRGQILITTRNRNLAFYPTDGGLEVTEWDTHKGSDFLLHLLKTDIGHQLTETEARSAQELSLKLSGHALALSLMAGLIHRRSWSIEEFVELYKRQPQKVSGTLGSNSINALWELSFQSLKERSRAILGVLSYLSPDSVPQALFEPSKTSPHLPASLAFCSDAVEFSDELEILMTLALVKRNKERRSFSIHRLVQTTFKDFLGPEGRQNSFNDAARLVSAAFPRKSVEYSQLYHAWKPCALYLPHVLSLRDYYREERLKDPGWSAPYEYCDLNNACQRFLIETNGYSDLLDLVEVNAMALQTIPQAPSRRVQIVLETELASHRGQVLARVGRTSEGTKYLKQAYDIACTDRPRDLREEAYCADNHADAVASTNDHRYALELQKKAREHFLEWARDESGGDPTEWSPVLKRGMGNNLCWAGELDLAQDILVQGLAQIEASQPYNWAMAAYTHHSLGNVARAQKDFRAAEKHYTTAYNKWKSGDNLLSDPFAGSCVYKIGCIALDQHHAESAIMHLRDAAIITERHKFRMPAEHARTMLKLSQALAMDDRTVEESVALRDGAKKLLLSRSNKAADTDAELTYDDLIFIGWR